MSSKREQMVELNDQYDSGDIGKMEYELGVAELSHMSRDTTEDDDMNIVDESSSNSKFLFATTEQELVDAANELMALWPSDMEGEWLTDSLDRNLSMMAGRSIGSLDSQLSWVNGAISKAKVTAQRDLDSRDGSEVSEQKLMRSTRWLKQVRGQKKFVEARCGTDADLLAAKLAYKAYFGRTWMPYSATQALAEGKKMTAAAEEARKELAQ